MKFFYSVIVELTKAKQELAASNHRVSNLEGKILLIWFCPNVD